MKLSRLVFLVVVAIATIALGCKPDKVSPKNGPDMGAFNATEYGSGTSGAHEAPEPGCSNAMTGTLVLDYLGNAYPVTGATYILVNDETHFYAEIKAVAGWGFSEVAFDAMTEGVDPPKDINGMTDMAGFTSYTQLSPNVSWYGWKVPMEEFQQLMNVAVAARLVNSTNPAQNFVVWLNGAHVPNSGGFTIDYQLSMVNCMNACEPWIDATVNPCVSAPPACQIPSVAPGADLSEYACGNPNAGKVTVCHFPPGNPENMQEICISTNALPAHIIDFKPANDPCMGHHSGCHLGSCDPCGPGSSADHAASIVSNCPGN
ncbi:MAG: hypothetical protein H6581_09655 [Bacteroidia bacterium]|nr:hypothetical protein [Bacteroidia bacterium]